MESISQIMNLKRVLLLSLAYSMALPIPIVPQSVDAGTAFLIPPPPRKLTDADLTRDEDYPESRFGAPPSRTIANDTRNQFAAREVDDWDYRAERAAAGLDEQGSKVVRAPASSLESDYVSSGAATNVDLAVTYQKSGSARTIASLTQDQPTHKAVPELQAAAIRRKGVQEVALIASDLGFFPRAFFVSRDIPVRLYVTGASKNSLCIMMDSFQVRKQVRSQKIEEITFTPNQPGTYRFYCPVNGMEGSMVVKEFASAIPDGSPND